jgi:ABC-type sugar transport system permease subunit
MKITKLNSEQKHMAEGLMFISPWIIGCAVFFVNPIVKSIILSFSKITKMKGFVMEWVGFQNYAKAFMWDVKFIPMFLNVVKNTFINTPITLVFAMFIAILINRPMKGRGLFRTIFFLPVLLGTGFIMNQLLNVGVGTKAMAVARGIMMPEAIMKYVGPYVSGAIGGFFDRITMILWKSGVQIVLFLAGLQGISTSLYEAAYCDGCTEWEMFWKVTLPIMSPVVLLNFIYSIIDSFTDASNPIVDYVINTSFKSQEYAYGAAMGWIYFIFIFIVCLVIFGAMKNKVYNSGEK